VKTFYEVFEDTKEKLGRPLQDKEVKFLKWLYKRYEKERAKEFMNK